MHILKTHSKRNFQIALSDFTPLINLILIFVNAYIASPSSLHRHSSLLEKCPQTLQRNGNFFESNLLYYIVYICNIFILFYGCVIWLRLNLI